MRPRLWVPAFFLCFSIGVMAQSQQTGSIVGTISDGDRASIPGVQISLSSDALMRDRQLVTNANGNYTAALLPPGKYLVSFSMPGFKTVQQTITVGIGHTVRADATLVPIAITEQISVVSAKVSALEAEGLAVNFTADKVDQLPISNRRLSGLLSNAPAVTRGGAGGQHTITGAVGRDNQFLLNGANISDPAWGGDLAPYIEDAVQETQVLVSGTSVRYGGFTGGVVNGITKSGSNHFAGTLRVEMENDDWNARNPFLTGEQTDDIQKEYQATLGGPIVKDKLWFFVATKVLPTSDGTGVLASGDTFSRSLSNDQYEGKLTWSITPMHTVSLDYNTHDTEESGWAFLRPASADIVSNREDSRDMLAFNYTGMLNDHMFLEISASDFETVSRFGGDPNGGHVITDEIAAGGVVIDNNMFFGNWASPSVRGKETLAADLNIFHDGHLGLHDIHVGVQYVNSITGGLNRQTPTGGLIKLGRYGGTRSHILWEPNGDTYYDMYSGEVQVLLEKYLPDVHGKNRILSFYAEDSWTPNPKLSVQAGLRYDRFESNAYISDNVSANDISPRVSITYDWFGDHELKLIASIAKYVGRMHDDVANAGNPVGNQPMTEYRYVGPDLLHVTRAEFNDPQSDAYQALFDPANLEFIGDGAPETSAVDPNMKPPYSLEYTLTAKKAVGLNGHVEASYIYKNYKRNIDTVIGGYGQVTTEGVLGGTSLVDRTLWTNVPLKRTYQGLILSGALSGEVWDLSGSFSFSEVRGNYDSEEWWSPNMGTIYGDYEGSYDPAFALPEGRLPGDVPFRARLFGTYRINLTGAGRLTLGGLARYESGSVYSYTAPVVLQSSDANGDGIDDTRDFLGSAPGTYYQWDYYFNGERGGQRFPSVYDLDLSFTYNLPLARFDFWVKLDVIGALNRKRVSGWSTWVNSFGTFQNTDGNLIVNAPELNLNSSYGLPSSPSHYSSIRSYRLSTGFRFDL
ncbi:TonB-dependent receptor [Sulfidibacter corallicola]|uniref:TonB-dependent receptor n=1 Tax=Sulfidibacter corallicola TaxID=2818388 RepID=A0A8A4TEJ5_SULCO|nr:TonB-dependent receptor [Sulfidibacter corallicola]QTD47644.1 TonB-dependent receptor [Sulfidibacter corallicola]